MYNPLSAPCEDFDVEQLKVRRVTKTNDESEGNEYVCKPRSYNSNQTSENSEEFRGPRRRMGYAWGRQALHSTPMED